MKINNENYLFRVVPSIKNTNGKAICRVWWMIKEEDNGSGVIHLGNIKIRFAKHLIGRKVCFKMEFFNNDNLDKYLGVENENNESG